MLVPDLLRRSAAAAPAQIAAVVDRGDHMTYGAWEARSNALARGLVGRGVAAGDRVGLFFDNAAWLDYAVAYFATLKAGGVAVPLSSRWAAPELEHVLAHAGCRTVLAEHAHETLVRRIAPRTVEWIASDLATLIHGRDTATFQVERSEEDLADIIYTSGTTGLPKGVAAAHGNVSFDHFGGGDPWAGQTFVHAIPLATFAGTYAMMVLPAAGRMITVVLPRFDPERFCAVIAERRATVTYLVPAMARLILDSRAGARHDLSSVRIVRFGTAPMPPDTLAALAGVFPNAVLINVYGLTEAGPAGTMTAYDPARPESVGRPIGGARLRVVGEAGATLPAGESGEIWIGLPPGLPGRRYYGDDTATAETFRDDWVRTGDLGYVDRDGFLFVVDRAKDVVIRGGYKISTVEVENVLRDHPSVGDVAVIGVPHEVLGEDVAAVVVPRPGAGLSADELIALCRGRLADYKVPRRIEFVEALPRNALGKVLKRDLRARFIAGVSQP